MTQTILLVEDLPGDALLMQDIFSGAGSEDFTLEWAETLSAAFERLKVGDQVAAVLLDLSLPDGYGFHTISQMIAAAPKMPIIVLTGLEDEALAIKAVHAGAQDYLVKGQVHQGTLLRAIRYAIERKQEQEKLRASEARYRLLADNITDVVFTTTMDLKITHLTPSVTRLLGYQSDELLDIPMEHLITEQSMDRIRLMLEEELAPERSQTERGAFWSRREELEFIRKKGSTVWTEVKFSFLPAQSIPYQSTRSKEKVNTQIVELSAGEPAGVSNGGLLGVVRDITERRYWEETLKQANDALRVLATRDPLTGLFNRRYMEETLDREMHRAHRETYHIGLVIFDIDHFKDFNDHYGHVAGDLILRELGSVLRNNTRQSDVACRYGGEEFIIVMPGASPDLTFERAQKIREDVQNVKIMHNGQELNSVSVSAGVAVYPFHGKDVDELMMTADAALYRAKAEGRNQVLMALDGKE